MCACFVLQGFVGFNRAAIKVYNRTGAALHLFVAEAVNYILLSEVQGSSIPKLLALGRLPHSGAPVLALTLCQLLPLPPLREQFAASAREALACLHAMGHSHGDLTGSNLLVFEGRVLLCDLQTCQRGAGQDSLQRDVADLEQLLQD
eukprot:GHRQ01033845.1.p2 GENE.GHRQ01033845.1~~GHRQ01033845.1.p2  ORF type:complete len:147 (-),score=51.62 GHRQ01033845.1:548-988(-)